MVKCNDDIIIKRGLRSLYVHCQLEKDHKGKHQYEGKSEGRVFWIEWKDELPVIEGLTEMYVEENAIEKGYKK